MVATLMMILWGLFIIFIIITQIKVFRISRKYSLFFTRLKDLEEKDREVLLKINRARIYAFVVMIILMLLIFFINRK